MGLSFTASFLITSRPSDAKIDLLTRQMQLSKAQVEMCIAADPSPNQTDFVTWIARMVKGGLIRLPEDAEGIKENLSRFQTQKRQPGFGGNKDINSYKTPGDLARTLEANAMTVIRSKNFDTFKNLPGQQIIVQKGDFVIFKVTNPEALRILSDSTEWCTRHGAASSYLRTGPSYVIFYRGLPFAQLHPSSNQYKDRRDESLIVQYHQPSTKKRYKGWGHYEDVPGPLIGTAITHPIAREAADYIAAVDPQVDAWMKKQNLSDPVILGQQLLTNNDHWIDGHILTGTPLTPEEMEYLKIQWPSVGIPKLKRYADKFYPRQRWELFEYVLLKNLGKYIGTAVEYANDHIRGRWPAIEPALLRRAAIDNDNATRALNYAATVIKGRWTALEHKFWTTAGNETMGKLAVQYALKIIKKPWREISTQRSFEFGGMPRPEMLMCKYAPKEAMEYAKAFHIESWDELGEILLADHNYTTYFDYLNNMKGGARDPRLEAMLTQPKSVFYNVQEPMDKRDRRQWMRDNPGNPVVPATKSTTKYVNKDAVGADYAEQIIKGRWPELEERYLNEMRDKKNELIPDDFERLERNSYHDDKFPAAMGGYIKDVIKGRWPELEAVLLQRYKDYPDMWQSNQALVAGYLNLLKPEKHTYEVPNWNKPLEPVVGIWPDGEDILKQRSQPYEDKLERIAEAEYRQETTYPEPDRDDPLWYPAHEIAEYVRWLRQNGEDWPEGVILLNKLEDFRDAKRREAKAQGKYYTSLTNRVASNELLNPKRILPLEKNP
jgi:hypothetical protein